MKFVNRAKTRTHFTLLVFALTCIFSFQTFSQAPKPDAKKPVSQISANLPKVTLIDEIKLKELTKPNGKPLLINFWATWCDPCREEFPDLVKIDNEYKGKINFITVSLDDLAEIRRDVPKFLADMKADMPSYLLKSDKEDLAIAGISKEWQGALPFTILYNAQGETVYVKQGKIKPEVLRAEIDKNLAAQPQQQKKTDETVVLMDFVKLKNGKRDEAMFFYENNWKIYREIALKKGFIRSFEIVEISPGENNQFDLVLITRYVNEEQFKNSEKNFEPILKETRPNGALLKNDLKPEDFRQNLFFTVGKPALGSENQ